MEVSLPISFNLIARSVADQVAKGSSKADAEAAKKAELGE